MPHLDEGAGVVTSRGDVHYVVTEYGVAYLHGKTIRERALALISIAHPSFRQDLLDFVQKKHYVYEDEQIFRQAVNPYPLHLERKEDVQGIQTLTVSSAARKRRASAAGVLLQSFTRDGLQPLLCAKKGS